MAYAPGPQGPSDMRVDLGPQDGARTDQQYPQYPQYPPDPAKQGGGDYSKPPQGYPATGVPAYDGSSPPPYPPPPQYGTPFGVQQEPYNNAPYTGYQHGMAPPGTGVPQGGRRRMGGMSLAMIFLIIGGFFLPFLWIIGALLPCCIPRNHPKRAFLAKTALLCSILLAVYLVLFAILMSVGWTRWRNTGSCPCSAGDTQCINYYYQYCRQYYG